MLSVILSEVYLRLRRAKNLAPRAQGARPVAALGSLRRGDRLVALTAIRSSWVLVVERRVLERELRRVLEAATDSAAAMTAVRPSEDDALANE